MKNIQSTSGLIMDGALARSMHPGDLPQIRQSPEWKLLRRQIVDKAIYFTDQLVFDFRRLLTQGRNAGEMLFLPAGCFHHVRAKTFSLSVNRWIRQRPLL